jgi:hypothetical protein
MCVCVCIYIIVHDLKLGFREMQIDISNLTSDLRYQSFLSVTSENGQLMTALSVCWCK